MASKKDKLLESAQRFLLKGQLDKAIKDYQQVVALEPREIRFRQKLAELLVRDNRKEEAITQYEDIGRHYAENSYYLKAIAVYKQIQRLSPDDPALYLTLGSLNHKQGLIGNALAEYGQVAARYEKEGALKEAVKVLEQMLQVDAAHLPTRLKLAELLLATGSRDASFQAFSSLLASLRAGADSAAAQDVAARMHQLFPEEQENDLDQVAQRIQQGDPDGAIASLQERLKRDEGNLQAWHLLCEAERAKGNRAGLRSAYQRMAELFATDATVVEGAIRCEIEAGDHQRALAQLELHLPVLIQNKTLQPAEELYLSLPAEVAADPRVNDGLRRVYEAVGAWDKLSALKRGPAQAQAPGGAAVPSAFDPASASLETALAAEPPSAFGSPWAPEAPSAAAPQAAAPQAAAEVTSPWEEEIELDLDDDLYETVLAATPEADLTEPAPQTAPEAGVAEDFSLALSFSEPAFPGEGASEAQAPEAGAPEFSDLSAFEEVPASAEATPFEATSVDAEPSSLPDPFAPAAEEDWEDSLPLDLALPEDSEFEELELVEPELVEPELVEPELVEPELVEPESVEELAEPELADAASLTEAPAVFEAPEDLGIPELPEASAGTAALEPPADFPDFDLPEDLGSSEPLEAQADTVALEVPAAFADFELPEDLGNSEVLEAPVDAALEVPAVPEVLVVPEVPEVPEEPEPPAPGWETIYPDLETSDAPLDLEELESHYDLGIGYKEMGMYNAAIKEFSVAAANPQRRLACLTLQAICHREKGEPDQAQELLQRGRALKVLNEEERMSLSYELASLWESTGAVEEAIELYREVLKLNPHFGDVAQKLAALTGDEPLDVIELEECEA